MSHTKEAKTQWSWVPRTLASKSNPLLASVGTCTQAQKVVWGWGMVQWGKSLMKPDHLWFGFSEPTQKVDTCWRRWLSG